MSNNTTQTLVVAFAIAGFCVLAAKHFQKRQAQPAAAVAQKAPAAPQKVAIAPAAPIVQVGYGEQRLTADAGGQYETDVQVNGSRLHMIVDTGATYVTLSAQDAARIGVYPAPADYKYSVRTANGEAKVAMVTLTDVRIGTILLERVEALVSGDGALSTSLLGMSFLKRLSKMEVASGALVLKQ